MGKKFEMHIEYKFIHFQWSVEVLHHCKYSQPEIINTERYANTELVELQHVSLSLSSSLI